VSTTSSTTTTSDDFGGAGAPPPPKEGSGGFKSDKLPELGFTESIIYKTKEGERKQGSRHIFTWYVEAGQTNKPILILDPMHSKEHPRRAVYIHGPFEGRDGKFGNLLVSIWKDDSRGDPMNDALGKPDDSGTFHPKEPTWYWALTGIDLSVTKKGDKVYTNQRVLVLVTAQQKDQFLSVEKMGGGLRGWIFNVSRPKENPKKTYRIGPKWDPQEKLTEEQMTARFEKAAADYGLPVEKFIAPFDYPTIFKPKSYEELAKIAEDMKGARAAGEGVKVAEGDDEAIKF